MVYNFQFLLRDDLKGFKPKSLIKCNAQLFRSFLWLFYDKQQVSLFIYNITIVNI